jgi:very-short-patch-repair endonuclease
VFTNLTSSDIDTSKSQKRGIKALKSFLHFAQHGKLDVPVETGKPFDSPFEERVYDDLVRLGYTVRQQVGSQGFYLDLAIVDPEHPGRYLLGIECDGAAYHSARSARDRDRLRQQVLEGIGWRIHRIWSTDWFRNPERELKRAVEAIEKAKLRYQAEDEITGEEEIIESHFAREHLLDDVAVPLYEFAVLPPAIGTKELHMHPVGALSGWVVEVVTKESPVHFDEVARRMAEAAGIARVGSRIRDQLLLATKFAEGSQKIIRKGDFLWAAGMHAAIIRDRSNFGASSKKLKYISPEELSLGTQKIINDSIAIGTDEAISMIAKLFGFSRVTEEMRKELLEVVRLCVTDGKIAVEGTVLRPKLKEVI